MNDTTEFGEKIIGPNPNSLYPIKGYDKLVFLKNFVKASNIFVGDYTYFDDCRNGPDKFEEYNVLYNYDFSKVKLVIGKFCAIAAETRFIMTGDHKLDAIIATKAVVVKDVPAYSIVAGNPAKVVKMRFDEKTIDRLQKIAWWNWSIEKINKHMKLLCHLDVDQLEKVACEIE